MNGRRWGEVALVIGLWAAVYLIGLGERGLWNPVEPRYAGIAAELLREGEWLVPRYNGELYDQKPPLFFWVTAGSLAAGGEPTSRFLVRLPSALGALGMLLATMALGWRLHGGRAGMLAALVLLSSWAMFHSGRFCHMDLPQGAALALSVLALVEAWQDTCRGARRAGWIAIGALAMAAGLLMKGPAALLFPALIVFGVASWERQWRWIARSGIGWMALVATALAAAWFVPAWRIAGNDWAKELVLGQGIGRLFDGSQPRKHSVWYYPVVFWWIAGPLSLLLVPALWRAFTRPGPGSDGRATRLTIIWLVGVVGVLMLGQTQRSRYLLAALPASALLIGRFVDREVGAPGGWPRAPGWTVTVGLFTLAPVMALAMLLVAPDLAVAFWPGDAELQRFLAGLAREAGTTVVAVIVLLVMVALGIAAAWRRRATAVLVIAALACAASYLALALPGARQVDDMRGDAELVAVLREQVAAGRAPVVLGRYGYRESALGFLGFHLQTRILHLEEGGDELRQLARARPCVLIVREIDRPAFVGELLEGWSLVRPGPLGHDELWIHVNDGIVQRGR